jgi:CubicO group peptidase (beta-lactamase class C family)
MSQVDLSDFVRATAVEFGIPGVAVGVWAEGRETYACHGVTSLDHPLPVDPQTLCQLGSITKTFTATALMCLVAAGRVELEAPVRRYVPELRLIDERLTADVTVLNLLNHTSGLDWGFFSGTGDGDDALRLYVAKMAELEQIAPLGARMSYSNAGYSLVGRIIEKVTDMTYEDGVASLVFEPVGLSNSFFAPADVMTRRFNVGHNPGGDGTPSVARPWRGPRCGHPGGGIASSASDQLRWARFHLGDGRAADGARVLPTELLQLMKEQTVEMRGSTLGDALGISWFLRDIDGVRTVGHGGSMNGQYAELLTVPERDFAIFAASNAGPDGIRFDQAVVRWALETYLGVAERDPEPIAYDGVRAQEIAGTYETGTMVLTVGTTGTALTLEVVVKPELRAEMGEEVPDYAPFDLGLLPGDTDEYMLTSGAFKGMRGFFTRNEDGTVTGADLAGRLFSRIAAGGA